MLDFAKVEQRIQAACMDIITGRDDGRDISDSFEEADMALLKALATYASTILYNSAKSASEMGIPDILLNVGLEGGIKGLPAVIFSHLSAFRCRPMWTNEGAGLLAVASALGRYPHSNTENLAEATKVLVKMAIEIDPRNKSLEVLL
jgi:hypothetical protein